MKTLKFKSHLAEKILAGTKMSTWRLFDDKNLGAGDEVTFINSDTGKEFAKAKLTWITLKTLENVTEEDYDGNEKDASKEDMYAKYRGYYGDKVRPETLVKIITFTLFP